MNLIQGQAASLTAFFGRELLDALHNAPRPPSREPLPAATLASLGAFLATTVTETARDTLTAQIHIELLRTVLRVLRPVHAATVPSWITCERGLDLCAHLFDAALPPDVQAVYLREALALAVTLPSHGPRALESTLTATPPAIRRAESNLYHFAWTIPVKDGVTSTRRAVRTDANGRFLGRVTDVEHADRWGTVRAASPKEARMKFEREEGVSWAGK